MPVSVSTSNAITQQVKALVHAPPGWSKTFSSLTLSDKCPVDLNHQSRKMVIKREPPVLLDDLLWLAFDSAATIGFEQQGIRVPVIDLSGIMTKDFETDLATIPEHVKKASMTLAPGRRLKVIADTITRLDTMNVTFHRKHRGLTGHDLWGAVAKTHADFIFGLMSLPVDCYFLCHSKALMEQTDTSVATANTRRSRDAGGLSGVIPQISGSSLNFYRGEATFIFTTSKRLLPGTEGSEFYFVADDPIKEVKGRLKLLNDKKEAQREVPADWRVVRKMAGLV